uniref:Uncharacterized protein n=1 Tax=Oreochromis niloticus TaxID=8128 RepID=A0A669EVT3_ORENI
MPDNYTSEQSWDARLLMERCRAVKSPDISAHLAGTKKVQQVLARPGVLERFFPDQPQAVQQIRATFLAGKKDGGGKDVQAMGQSLFLTGFWAWSKRDWLVAVSNVSLFFVFLQADMVINECVGHLLRTKSSGHSDGGVAAGVTVLDNPLLF